MISGLRVTFGGIAKTAQYAMTDSLSKLNKAQQTLTTGKRITKPSDDPGGAAQVIRLNNALGDLHQYTRNGDEAKSYLALTDSALDSVGGLVREARTLALQAATSTNAAPEAAGALAEKIGRIKEQVHSIAGTNLRGRYIFAGQQTLTRPFDPADAANTYQGDTGQMRVEINRGEYVAMNVPGDTIFAQLLTDLDTLKADVLAGNTDKISKEGVLGMEAGLNRVLGARGRVGALVNQIENTRTRLDAAQQEFKTLASNIEDVDISEAIVALQAAQNAYQASLASTAKTFQNSLMDYLR